MTKLDLLKGYWQVPLTARAREIFAFVTPDAFLQYTVILFGIRNAPATFQRLVNPVLFGSSGCEAYLDDIVVYSNSLDDHIQQLCEVFGRLRDANLTLNLARCEFGQATVTYLGKIVGRGQVKPAYSKLKPFCHSLFRVHVMSCAIFWGWQGTIGASVEIFLLLRLHSLIC